MNSFHFLVSKIVILIGFKILSIPMGYIDIGMIYFLMTSAFVLSFVFMTFIALYEKLSFTFFKKKEAFIIGGISWTMLFIIGVIDFLIVIVFVNYIQMFL